MGTTLTGTTPQDTYDSLIKVTDNGPLSGTAKYLSDGLGNDSALALSTTAVGIGTASPAGRLSVEAAGNHLTVRASTAAAGKYWALDVTAANQLYIINNAGTQYLTITDAGNVGIGTSNPVYRLDVHTSAGNAIGNLQCPNDSGAFHIYQNGVGNAECYIGINNATATLVGGVGGAHGAFVVSYNARPIGFGIDGSERMRVTTNGLTFNGDTAAANALDDYEEGTWTMGVSFGGGSTGVTFANNTGTYTKIGRQVTVTGYANLTSKGSSTGNAAITGLPFTLASPLGAFSSVSLHLDKITFANQYSGYGVAGSTTIEFREITEAGVGTALTEANFANDSSWLISLTYFV